MSVGAPNINALDFAFVRQLLHQRAAIILEDGKEYFLEARLLRLSKSEGFASITELLAKVRATPGSALQQRVIDALTINETSFFRDLRSFDALRKVVIPEAMTRNARTRTLTLWSAASASGQEPYSLAMMLRDHFPQLREGWKVRLFASDLSQEMIERCRAGRYSQLEVNRGLPAAMLVKYFQRAGLDWVVKDELRQSIDFAPVNLVADWPQLGQVDVMLLRNVMIYFDMETKRRILERVHRVLAPGGVLMLGAAETTLNLDNTFVRVPIDSTYVYRNPG